MTASRSRLRRDWPSRWPIAVCLTVAMTVPGSLVEAAVSTPPRPARFTYRGVVQGFYGTPWTDSARMGTLAWMSRRGMNLYIHAPKDDPYHRSLWRHPYPHKTMRAFSREVSRFTSRRLRWVPAISPGWAWQMAPGDDRDICFSCPDDRAVLFGKLDAFWSIGVRAFMLSFDDGYRASSHPEDAAVYGEGDEAYGFMTADLLNAVYERYRARTPRFTMFTVLPDFAGTSSTPYLDAVRGRLRPEVIVLWTGPQVISPTITCADAMGYAAAIGRVPLVWDNFPVNDYAPDKLVVGPYKGRAADLATCVRGVVANPAPQARASRISLGTVTDYLQAPGRYRPNRSWSRSLRAFAGRQVGMLRPFIESVRSTLVDPAESIRFSRLRDALVQSLGGAHWPDRAARLRHELVTQRRTPGRLRRNFAVEGFVTEVDGGPFGSWLQRLAFNAGNGLETLEYLLSTKPRARIRTQGRRLVGRATVPASAETNAAHIDTVLHMRERDDGNPATVHGVRSPPGSPATNQMDLFFELAAERLTSYQSIAPTASSSIDVSVNGRPVRVRQNGRFTTRPGSGRIVVRLTDGAGQETRYVVRASYKRGTRLPTRRSFTPRRAGEHAQARRR